MSNSFLQQSIHISGRILTIFVMTFTTTFYCPIGSFYHFAIQERFMGIGIFRPIDSPKSHSHKGHRSNVLYETHSANAAFPMVLWFL
ncbi:MAG: hypothetical protein Greene041614_273 [Parcubacteria group bacterium Greene0416_14]|nr:MAG: hypothetical protein Greene041614_273 [Parcubacteria group bacterium Greene0416_14]TSC99859.1 MAG: hypothetical protein Greene101415_1047 [Parcubacteria group bacterium Greene1014_15]